MSLTLANAADVRDHQDNAPPARGFTRTRHRACCLGPGDLWLPDGDADDRHPLTVMAARHHSGQVVLVDQYGARYIYPADAIISTAVLDAWSFPRLKRWN